MNGKFVGGRRSLPKPFVRLFAGHPGIEDYGRGLVRRIAKPFFRVLNNQDCLADTSTDNLF